MRIHGICKVTAATPAFLLNSGVFDSVVRAAPGQFRVTLKEAVDAAQNVAVPSIDHDMAASAVSIGVTQTSDTQYLVTMGGAAPVDADFGLVVVALL